MLAAVVIAWLLLIGTGIGMLWRHTQTPGRAAKAPGDWPADSAIPVDMHQPILVMWCHPQCPCTAASLEALASLERQTGDRLKALVLFYRPKGAADSWLKGANWELAHSIRGVEVAVDDGSEALRFGARTSGHTVIFDRDGRLRFSGGLTPARGHGGECAAMDAAIRLATTGKGEDWHGPVYGCALFTPAENSKSELARDSGLRTVGNSGRSN